MNIELIPLVMRVLGILSRKLKKRLGKIGIEIKIIGCQKTWRHLLCEDSPKRSWVVKSLIVTMPQKKQFPLTIPMCDTNIIMQLYSTNKPDLDVLVKQNKICYRTGISSSFPTTIECKDQQLKWFKVYNSESLGRTSKESNYSTSDHWSTGVLYKKQGKT